MRFEEVEEAGTGDGHGGDDVDGEGRRGCGWRDEVCLVLGEGHGTNGIMS